MSLLLSEKSSQDILREQIAGFIKQVGTAGSERAGFTALANTITDPIAGTSVSGCISMTSQSQ
jgi:hypothetical protein